MTGSGTPSIHKSIPRPMKISQIKNFRRVLPAGTPVQTPALFRLNLTTITVQFHVGGQRPRMPLRCKSFPTGTATDTLSPHCLTASRCLAR